MIESLKIIKKTQHDAKKLITEALFEAEKINQNMIQISIDVREESYLAEITQAKKRATELVRNTNISVDLEVKKILSKAEQQAKQIEIQAKTKHEQAVTDILNLILNRGGKNFLG